MANNETLTGTESATGNVSNLKSAYTAFKSLAERASALQEELATVKAEMAEQIGIMSESLPKGATNFKADGRILTPVQGAGRGGNSAFLRGFAPAKERGAKETLDLDV